jgi:hypothetical protein
LRSRVRKSRRDLWITLYINFCTNAVCTCVLSVQALYCTAYTPSRIWPSLLQLSSKFDYRHVSASYIFCIWLRLVQCCKCFPSHEIVRLLSVAWLILSYKRMRKEFWTAHVCRHFLCSLLVVRWTLLLMRCYFKNWPGLYISGTEK